MRLAPLAAAGDGLPPPPVREPSQPGPGATAARACSWCRRELPVARSDARFCCKLCRQTARRARRAGRIVAATARPLRMAYADPPYPGCARRFYRSEEVEHANLIANLVAHYDGWALSTSAAALRHVLPLCPARVRVCAWVKPISANPRSWGLHNTWEPLLVCPGRSLRPGKRDWLSAQPARRGGNLPGRKPLAFCGWLFGLLGLRPGDTFDDLYPGTGIVGRAWAELSRAAAGDVSPGDDDGA